MKEIVLINISNINIITKKVKLINFIYKGLLILFTKGYIIFVSISLLRRLISSCLLYCADNLNASKILQVG